MTLALRGLKALAALIAGQAIVLFARLVTAPRAVWAGSDPVPTQRIYFANHTSNGDFVLAWAVLPPALRERTRPVAASDYWLKSRLRAFAGRDVFRAVLIDRNPETRDEDPVEKMVAALNEGASLIIFPEGGRNMGPDPLLPFKTGIYHVAHRRPDVELVPTWIENLNAILPKGEVIPVPLLCTVTYGQAVHLKDGEDKDAFLGRAAQALRALKPERPE
ncbi:lysophospholipid acyltransferase family protein [Maritimibacter sp. UBA3975]|uniref:lysophospholipid acyltransferase family protein n=1 Tax=Maritimibacter sp. UBA3975 TaxID=1946833 RepID=UPI000C0A0D1D|nr:lysophospholipid acyltransferase family protein [Maritimibacter sp. UBA3975]MAM61977.1 1-acyl-sn-glycerol-3-phosphate acyltransferase [Maritimibacter sp.]|tara:strand:+ start:1933 stop:2589 length:657 start_codon:yes stop_codon:yes gene_type:complete